MNLTGNEKPKQDRKISGLVYAEMIGCILMMVDRIKESEDVEMKKYELTMIERLMRQNKEHNVDGLFNHVYKFEFEGKVYNGFCNGYYIMASCTDDFGFTENTNPNCHMSKTIQENMKIFEYNNKGYDFSEIYLDKNSIEQRKKYNKENHCKLAHRIDMGGYLNPGFNSDLKIGVDPVYALDFMRFFNVEYCYILKDGFGKNANYINPIFFRNDAENKIGCLMPVNLDANDAASVNRNAA